MASYFKEALTKQERTRRRVDLVGSDGVNKQDTRRRAIKKGDHKAMTRDVQQRMREYKGDKVIDKVKVIKHPENK
jgi:ubiquinone/menaquinone biosynthesis C-methylase UbiE